MRNWIIPAVAAFALAGCGSGSEGTIETEDGDVTYTVDGDDGESKITLESPDGQAMVTSGSDVKPDLPDGIGIFPGARISNVTNIGVDGMGTSGKAGSGKGSGSMVTLKSDASAQEVADWYRETATKAGFRIEGSANVNDMVILGGKAEDGREFSLTVSADGKGSQAQLIAGEGL